MPLIPCAGPLRMKWIILTACMMEARSFQLVSPRGARGSRGAGFSLRPFQAAVACVMVCAIGKTVDFWTSGVGGVEFLARNLVNFNAAPCKENDRSEICPTDALTTLLGMVLGTRFCIVPFATTPA
jgi:hypothetical protein